MQYYKLKVHIASLQVKLTQTFQKPLRWTLWMCQYFFSVLTKEMYQLAKAILPF